MRDLLSYVLGLIDWLARKIRELSEIAENEARNLIDWLDWLYPTPTTEAP